MYYPEYVLFERFQALLLNPQPNFKQYRKDVKSGKLDPDAALTRLKELPFEDLGFAKLDHHRSLRTGIPEVIYAPGKTGAQIVKLVARLRKDGINALVTRTDKKIYKTPVSSSSAIAYYTEN